MSRQKNVQKQSDLEVIGKAVARNHPSTSLMLTYHESRTDQVNSNQPDTGSQ